MLKILYWNEDFYDNNVDDLTKKVDPTWTLSDLEFRDAMEEVIELESKF